jgi:hypothetical protein
MASLPPPVDRILKAADGHDTDAFLDCFSDDGVVDDWGSAWTATTYRG